eukprot:8741159-Pyramimonas_sp.AAC.1
MILDEIIRLHLLGLALPEHVVELLPRHPLRGPRHVLAPVERDRHLHVALAEGWVHDEGRQHLRLRLVLAHALHLASLDRRPLLLALLVLVPRRLEPAVQRPGQSNV